MGKTKAKRQPAPANPALEEQIARMRELLRLMAPETGTAALGAIRQAFPQVPLATRVNALSAYRAHAPDAEEPSPALVALRAASA